MWRSLLATLVAGGTFSPPAQGNAQDTNAAPTNATAAATETGPNAAVTHPVAAVEPAPPAEPGRKPAASPGKLDYSSFKVVSERNIFNGNRSGQRMTATRSSTQQRSVRVESFSLVGTLLSDDKAPVAFFDGTSSEFRKALKAGGNVAGFTVKDILHAGVRLIQGTNTLEVRVGSGLRREDEGLWKASEGGTSYAASSGSSSSSSTGRSYGRNGSASGRSSTGESSSASSSGSAAASTDAAEILKRLMEKREKE